MGEPRAGEVVVAVAGAALGVEPRAEVAGTVVAAGEAARDWIGRRVVVPRILPCGDCDACRRGRVAHCPARLGRDGLGARETVPARWLVSVQPPLWPEGAELWQLAALADAALAPYTALARAGMGPGDTVVLVGNDARARFAAAIAAAKGAHAVVDDGTRAPAPGAIVVSTRGTRRDRQRALALVAEGGTAVLLDGAEPEAAIETDWSRLVRAEAHVFGVVGGHPDLLPELCALAARGQLPLADSVARVAPSDVERAWAAYRAEGGRLPVAVPA